MKHNLVDVTQKTYANKGNPLVLQYINSSMKEILDVGCGAGDNANILYQNNKIVDGITLSEREKAIAQQFCRNVYIHNLENGLPNITSKYDAVICSHVLEHICYPEKLLNDIHNILKDTDSRLIIALPNIMYYNHRIELIKGNFNYTEGDVMDYTHFRWYTFETGKQLLEKHGFKIEIATIGGLLPLYSIISKLPQGLQTLIRNLLYSISKGFFGYELIYVAKKV